MVFRILIKIKPKHSIKSYAIIVIFFAVLQNQKPLNFITYYFISSQTSEAISKRKELLLKEKYLKATQCEYIYDTILIIQGESANKHHMSVYNYSIDTTPFLNTLSHSSNFYKYDIIAPSNQTRFSVPMMFTDADIHSWYEKYSNSVSLITKLKRCGFQTHWISTQSKTGRHEDAITSIAQEADDVVFLANTALQDEIILQHVQNRDTKLTTKQAYIFHISGSHFRYSSRYKDHKLYNNASTIVQEYDNSIFSTDFLLGEILKSFSKNKKTLFVYFSDHGEVVSPDKAGHGYYPSYKDEFDIPFIMYSGIVNPRLRFNENNQKRLNGESINHILEYVIGITQDKNFSYSDTVFSLTPKTKSIIKS
ncbi:MAG TPA: phosphoethanolamine transferase [Sulfurimonas sp.]|nr:phosphoethanolamine transferase [Sulfurimonas sp.]HIM75337.1 phosphoethanolamine transferase [Campylobacterales bacterium]